MEGRDTRTVGACEAVAREQESLLYPICSDSAFRHGDASCVKVANLERREGPESCNSQEPHCAREEHTSLAPNKHGSKASDAESHQEIISRSPVPRRAFPASPQIRFASLTASLYTRKLWENAALRATSSPTQPLMPTRGSGQSICLSLSIVVLT